MKGAEIRSSSGMQEQAEINSTVADLTSQFDELHSRAEVRNVELQEAGELWDRFENLGQFVTGYCDSVEQVVSSKLIWTDLGAVNQQLAQYKVCMASTQIC